MSDTIAPPPPSLRMTDIIDTLKQLSHIINTEITLLKTMRISELADFQEEKLRLVHMLEITQQLLKTKPEILAAATNQEKETFQELSTSFNALLEENYKEMTKAVGVNQEVIRCITAAAREHLLQQAGYDGHGILNYSPKYHGIVPPLTVNDEV